jgi:hypothetical protein
MIVDITNCFQRNPEILQDVCAHRVEIANFVMNLLNPEENYDDVMFYESEIRHYKLYDV